MNSCPQMKSAMPHISHQLQTSTSWSSAFESSADRTGRDADRFTISDQPIEGLASSSGSLLSDLCWQLQFGLRGVMQSALCRGAAWSNLPDPVVQCRSQCRGTVLQLDPEHARPGEPGRATAHPVLSLWRNCCPSAIDHERGTASSAGEGLISQRRGAIVVEDRAGLEQATCECHGKIRQIFSRLLPHTYATV